MKFAYRELCVLITIENINLLKLEEISSRNSFRNKQGRLNWKEKKQILRKYINFVYTLICFEFNFNHYRNRIIVLIVTLVRYSADHHGTFVGESSFHIHICFRVHSCNWVATALDVFVSLSQITLRFSIRRLIKTAEDAIDVCE